MNERMGLISIDIAAQRFSFDLHTYNLFIAAQCSIHAGYYYFTFRVCKKDNCISKPNSGQVSCD